MPDKNPISVPPLEGVGRSALFVIEGEVCMWETDAGFLPYSAEVGGEDVVTKIAEAVDNLPEKDSRRYCLKKEGATGKRVRVTIEVLEMTNDKISHER